MTGARDVLVDISTTVVEMSTTGKMA